MKFGSLEEKNIYHWQPKQESTKKQERHDDATSQLFRRGQYIERKIFFMFIITGGDLLPSQVRKFTMTKFHNFDKISQL